MKILLFQANQIGKLLDLINIRVNLQDFNNDEKVVDLIYMSTRIKETNFMTEIRLYKLLGRSRKPIASVFQSWMININKLSVINSDEEYIFRSVYICNLYCEICLETISDEGNHKLKLY